MSRFIRLCLLMGWILFAGSAAQSALYTVVADRDALLREDRPNQNYGALAELNIRANPVGLNPQAPIFGFTLPSIPNSETIVSASIRLWVSRADARSAQIHRVTDAWAEETVTWANTAANRAAAAEASFSPSPSDGYVSVDLTALVRGWRNGSIPNHGVVLLPSNGINANVTAREWPVASQHPQLVITTAVVPPAIVLKSSQPASDPVNGATNPKTIPGAFVAYTVSVTNPGSFAFDDGSIVVVDATPPNMRFYVSDLPATSGPVLFQDGATASGLTYSFASLASTTDDIEFSNDGGASFSYVPAPDPSGVDPAVTHIRLRPRGAMAPGSSFDLRLRYLID